MKKILQIIIVFFAVIGCNSKKIILNAKLDIEEKPLLSYLTLEFKGNGTLHYTNDYFKIFCMKPVRDSTESYTKQNFNSILEKNSYFDNILIENKKGEFRRINNFYPLKDNIQTGGSTHCRGLDKIKLTEKNSYSEKRILVDPNFLKARSTDKKVRLHFLYKDSLNKSHIISNWILLEKK